MAQRLVTKRLALRPWIVSDAAAALSIYGDDQVSRSVQAPTKMAADDGPCMMTLASGGDQFFEVFGRTGLDVAGAVQRDAATRRRNSRTVSAAADARPGGGAWAAWRERAGEADRCGPASGGCRWRPATG